MFEIEFITHNLLFGAFVLRKTYYFIIIRYNNR